MCVMTESSLPLCVAAAVRATAAEGVPGSAPREGGAPSGGGGAAGAGQATALPPVR